jgi:plastocyanin
MPTRTPRILAALAVAAPLLLAACADDGGSADPTTPADLEVVAPGGLRWEFTEYSVDKTGPVTFALVNRDQQSHSIIFEDANGERVGDFRILAAGRRTESGTVDLAAGTYELICDIPGHRAAGMVATLTVG